MGRKSDAHHARREVTAYNEFAAEFERLAAGLDAFLDHGDFGAFNEAVFDLEDTYDGELEQIDPAAPRGKRLTDQARRLASGLLAKSFLLSLQRRIDERVVNAQAQLIAVSAETTDIPQYWQRLVLLVQAEGIRQEDMHPVSKALAQHIAKAIREFRSQPGAPVDDRYDDAPLNSWADLPREFAGFRLVDVDPEDNRIILGQDVFALPPSTDIAFFTADRVAPPVRHTRRATYDTWAPIIAAWDERKGRTPHPQRSGVWAMLLAHRLSDDSSKVTGFNRLLLQSPWERGAVVGIEVVEDDIPERFR